MSSRQAEKEQRRQERIALEQAESRARARRTRLQYVFGGLLALAAVAAVVLIVAFGVLDGGGSDGGDGGDGARKASDTTGVKLPPQETGDLAAAAKQAGCKVTHPEIEGANHLDKEFQAADYRTNPPTSGDHFGQWADDGIYEEGNPPLGMLVHTLEHGRINVQYKPGTPAETVRQLEALLAEQSEGYHMLLYENPTGMDAAVAATTWGHSVTCPTMSDDVIDVLRTFRAEYIDKGPENVP